MLFSSLEPQDRHGQVRGARPTPPAGNGHIRSAGRHACLEVSDRSELKSGVAAAAATKRPDGTFTAAGIDVGRGDVVP
jgi:hypothetical protein